MPQSDSDGHPEYYEDVSVGDTHEFGAYDVTKDEIIAFAEKYDPQPLHLDEEAAAETNFGGLIASGWHVSAMVGRMIVDHVIKEAAITGSLGIEEIHWMQAVRPGDTLSVSLEVTDKQPWGEGVGLVKMETEVYRNGDDLCGTAVGLYLYEMRDG